MHDDNLDSDNPNNKVDISALPFSQACENNKQPILEVLQIELQGFSHVLEIGSGTGQHSVYFAPNLPEIQWQTSDVTGNHRHIIAWHNAYPALNLYSPLAFDLAYDSVPVSSHLDSSHLDSGHLDSGHLDSGHLDSGHLDSGHLNSSHVDKPYDAIFTANTLHIIS